MKRVGGKGAVGPSAKAMKTEPGSPAQNPPPGQGDVWICKDCGNENWPLRTSCNKCKSPGPWTCPSCGNKNFQNRMVCNRKNCQLPRPGGMTGGGMMGQPMLPYQQPVAYQQPIVAYAQPMGKGAGDGSWTCSKCNNLNWPMRTACNKCGIQRQEGDPAMARTGGGKGAHPEGSWICSACENVNWPLRTTCKKCSAERASVDGGPPPSTSGATPGAYAAPMMQTGGAGGKAGSKGKGAGGHPEGSWVCQACDNVNWPARTSCKKCGAERAGVDGGPPAGGSEGGDPEGGDPEGSWTCPSCGNLNWPKRTTCNKKECGLPRPY